MQLKARYTRRHLSQLSFENTLQYFFYFIISNFFDYLKTFPYLRYAKQAILKWSYLMTHQSKVPEEIP